MQSNQLSENRRMAEQKMKTVGMFENPQLAFAAALETDTDC